MNFDATGGINDNVWMGFHICSEVLGLLLSIDLCGKGEPGGHDALSFSYN